MANFWDTFDPLKPTGIKDPDAVLDYPIDFSAWLADMGATYTGHSITHTGTITTDAGIQSAGIITVVVSGGTVGETASFTVRINATVSGSTRTDDRTFYLKIMER